MSSKAAGLVCAAWAMCGAVAVPVLAQQAVNPRTIVRIEPFQDFDLLSAFEPTMETLEYHCYSVTRQVIGRAVGAAYQEDIIDALKSTSGSLLLYQSHGDVGIIWGESFPTREAAEARRDYLVQFLHAETEDLALSQVGTGGWWTIGLKNSFTDHEVMARDVAVIATCYGSTTGDFNAACKLGGVGLCGDAELRQNWACLVGWMETSARATFDFGLADVRDVSFSD